MLVLGIDPSLTGTAVAAFAGDGVRVGVERFISRPCGKDARSRVLRYSGLAGDVLRHIRSFPEPPAVICLEGYSYGSTGQSILNIAEYGGILRRTLCLVDEAAIFEVAPTTLKKFATGKGSGKKVAVIAAISARHKVEFDSDDEYDAFALGQLALCIANPSLASNAAQRQAVATVTSALKSPTNKRR